MKTVADFLLALPFRYEDRRRFASVASLEWDRARDGPRALPGSPLHADAPGAAARRGGGRRRHRRRARRLAQPLPVLREGARGRGPPRGPLRRPGRRQPRRDADREPRDGALRSGRRVGPAPLGPDRRHLPPRRRHRAPAVAHPRPPGARPPLARTSARSARRPAGLLEALGEAHFPSHADSSKAALDELAREELLALAARIEDRRARLRERPGRVLPAEQAIKQLARYVLPFPLTNAQKRAVREIAEDLGSGRAMARLLQGDVGSGKTVVAGLAMLIAAKNGAQAALMAPTEILAEQHAESLASWLTGAGVRLGLLTGRVRGAGRKRLLEALAAGGIDALVGTHALVESPVRFRELGLVVVDEQHRFGVAHRARLFRKGEPLAARPHHDGHADPALPGLGDLRRARRLGPRREAAGPRRGHDAGPRGGSAGAGVRVRGRTGVPRRARVRRRPGDRRGRPRGRRDPGDGRAHRRGAARGARRRSARPHAARRAPGGSGGLRRGARSDPRLDDGRGGRRRRSRGDVHDHRERRVVRSGPAPPAPRARGPQPPPLLVRPHGRQGRDTGGAPAARRARADVRRLRRSPRRISRRGARATFSARGSAACRRSASRTRSATSRACRRRAAKSSRSARRARRVASDLFGYP